MEAQFADAAEDDSEIFEASPAAVQPAAVTSDLTAPRLANTTFLDEVLQSASESESDAAEDWSAEEWDREDLALEEQDWEDVAGGKHFALQKRRVR